MYIYRNNHQIDNPQTLTLKYLIRYLIDDETGTYLSKYKKIIKKQIETLKLLILKRRIISVMLLILKIHNFDCLTKTGLSEKTMYHPSLILIKRTSYITQQMIHCSANKTRTLCEMTTDVNVRMT